MKNQPLLSIDTNAKTVKGRSVGYMTGILYLAPANEAGMGNLCPMASKGCLESCLFTAGRGNMQSVKTARINKTLRWHEDRPAFMHQLVRDIHALTRKAERVGMIPCTRLNGTADIMWERQTVDGSTLFELFPDMQFYDYTKIPNRFYTTLPDNYDLTFSRSEENGPVVERILADTSARVAVVFNEIPETWNGYRVGNADANDLRFLDKERIAGLKAKGQAKRDETGFVVAA